MTKRMRSLIWLGLAGVSGISSCAEERPPISHVETGVVDKEIFQDSWYVATTVIDVDYEGAQLSFEGDSAYDYSGGIFTLPRVRWVIEKDFLLAYRDYELVQNTDRPAHPDTPAEDFRGEPVAAFPITSHFDIQRDYNPSTGEEINVLVENSTDRDWWERRFMRVDWSSNQADSYQLLTADLYEMFGFYTREPVSFEVAEGDSFPEDWKPVFRQMTCDGWEDADCSAQDKDHAGDYDHGDVYYMSFVTQALLTPGLVPDPFGPGNVAWCTSIYSDAPTCSTNLVTMRHAFLKVSKKRQYEALNYADQSRFDRFGLFRLEQPVVDTQVGGPGDPERGRTDARNYAAIRHNIWKQWWQVNEDGTRGADIPVAEREVRQIVYYMTKDTPYHLIRTNFEVASDWNVNYMRTVRELRGQPVPDSYDPYAQPQEGGYDCWIHTADGLPGTAMEPTYAVDQAEEEANGPTFDSDFAGWANVVMDGSECALLTRVNSCVSSPPTADDPGMPCEERGDLRFKFLSYISQPGTPFLGVATLRGDPITGEYMAGDANIGGPALDTYRTRALLWHDIASGRLTPETVIAGEDVREFFEHLGRVDAPAIPLRDFREAINVTVPGLDERTIQRKFQNAAERAEGLKLHGVEAPQQLFDQQRLGALVGTDIEAALLENDELLAVNGFWDVPAGVSPSENFLDQVSFARKSPVDQIRAMEERQRYYDERTMEFAGPGFDWAMLRYAMDHKDLPRSQLVYQVNRALYKGVQSHELGHCMGQRHNFGASTDVANYSDEYFAIDAAHPWPNVDDFDADDDGLLDAEEETAYRAAQANAKRDRDSEIIATHMSTSTMDYSSDWYEDLTAMGRYDAATILFAYGDLAEVRQNPDNLPADDSRTLTAPREIWRFYEGGEPCNETAQCPHAEDPQYRPGQVTQTCVPQDAGAGDATGVCSNFYDDLNARVDGGDREVLPVEYKFCTDDRVGSIGWCHRFDKGASFQEIVANQRERYHRDYIFNNFRRFRSEFGVGVTYAPRIIDRLYRIVVDIYQNMFYRYSYEDGYTTDRGPFGFYDQYLASAGSLNMFAEILAQPSLGGFNYNPLINEFSLSDVYPDSPNNDLQIHLGQGKYNYSVYQAGLTGIRKLDRIGIVYDRLWAMQFMFIRDWGWRYQLDQRWYVNYYDLFPDEMASIISGFTRDARDEYAARVACETFDEQGVCGNPTIQYMNHYRGDCRLDLDGDGQPDLDPAQCRPEPKDVYAGIPTIDSRASFLVQLYGPLYALAFIPTFYDTSFQQQFNICLLGQGDCSPPGEVDGVPEIECEPFTDCSEADYVLFTSDRYHATWMARNTEPGIRDISSSGISFKMIKETRELNERYIEINNAVRHVDEDGNPDPILLPEFDSPSQQNTELLRVRDRRDRLEDLFMWIRNTQRQFGIAY